MWLPVKDSVKVPAMTPVHFKLNRQQRPRQSFPQTETTDIVVEF